METTEILTLGATALKLVLILSMPAVLTALIVGLIVGLLQAVTQIQDQSIPFGIKLVAVIAAVSITIQWTGLELNRFMVAIFDVIPSIQP